MTAYITRRLMFLFFVLFGVSVLIFGLLMTFSPERRAAAYVTTPQQAEDIPRIVEQFGLTDPFPVQYARWVKEVASGNLGWSLVAARPVTEAFWGYFAVTLELNLFASPLVILIGIWLGTLSGVHRDTWLDHGTRIAAIIGWSLPTFLFALVLLMVFYGYLDLFQPGIVSTHTALWVARSPDFIRYTGMYTVDGILNGELWITGDALAHLVLPVITQIIVVVALLMRVMRSGMIEEMGKDYIITARAKGADTHTITRAHARPNALIPVITVAGQLVALAMEGSIAVEVVFSRQGMGWWLAESATQLDMPVLMSVCMFMGVVFVVSNLVIDILYARVDPRIRLT
ncbi:ABC transporter permease [Desulfoluna butyratoxydans]|uniref:Abc transporter type 1 transmembrane domain meti-like n=1 Tax=Desulfoluna butyratoxydans TaxID=231438 RepID=A0A4U8YHG3_9BACT|nr:ABC transporter permease [Desulfoluna butyratoxydans]VFQ43006.1 abc transporter type 1 transmembrane domain meti-like [Desulfoluna butyratoxydans]